MSLINDALKRAKEAQQQTPPLQSAGLRFQPVEPAERARRGLGLSLPFALAGFVLLGLFLVWQVAQYRGQSSLSSKPEQTTLAAAPATPAPIQQPPPATASPPPAQPGLAPANLPPSSVPAAPAKVASSPPPPIRAASDNPDATGALATTAVVVTQDQPATNTPAPLEPPKPAPPKLQAILFNPTRPSVMISGKTLFVGDSIGDYRISAIGQNSATLAGLGQTNVLNLAMPR
jgi:hypothetical protein